MGSRHAGQNVTILPSNLLCRPSHSLSAHSGGCSGALQPLEKWDLYACNAASHPDISSIVKNDEVRPPLSATAWTAFLTLLSEAIGDHGFLISSRPQAGSLHALCCCFPYCLQFMWAVLAFASWVLLCGASKTQCNAHVMLRSSNRNKLNSPFRLSLYVNNLPGMKSRSNRDNPPGACEELHQGLVRVLLLQRLILSLANLQVMRIPRMTTSGWPRRSCHIHVFLHHQNLASASYL
jgi:hypothetical protein